MRGRRALRSEEHTSELQSRELSSYAVFCLKKKKKTFAKSLMIRTCFPTLAYRVFDNPSSSIFFFFNDTATTEIYTSSHTLSLHDALPILCSMAAADSSARAHHLDAG